MLILLTSLTLLGANPTPTFHGDLKHLVGRWLEMCEGDRKCVNDVKRAATHMAAGFRNADRHEALAELARASIGTCAWVIKEEMAHVRISAVTLVSACSVGAYHKVLKDAGGEVPYIKNYLRHHQGKREIRAGLPSSA